MFTQLVNITEAGAIAASKWVGRGNKELADKAATEAMISQLNASSFKGKIVVSEYLKDDSFGLPLGEIIGNKNSDITYDICVDPIEGTTPTANNAPEAISVIGIANPGSMFNIKEFYAMKLAYGSKIAKNSDIKLSDDLHTITTKAAEALGKDKTELVVCLLDRPRHKVFIDYLRAINVKVKLIQDCDVTGAIITCLPDSGVDLLYGIGGAPEAVIAACALKCLGGVIQVAPVISGQWGEIKSNEDLVKGECAFATTGITNGSLLKGVTSSNVTHSVFMTSKEKMIRWVRTDFLENRP